MSAVVAPVRSAATGGNLTEAAVVDSSRSPSGATLSALPFWPSGRHILPHTARVADGRLMVGGCDLEQLAHTYGAPLLVYDEEHIRRRAREALRAFGSEVLYASKAFLCIAMARVLHGEGMRLEVCTEGELRVALAAGVPASRLVFNGLNKGAPEIALAMSHNVGRWVIDSSDEMDRIETAYRQYGVPIQALLRCNPDVQTLTTHPSLATGEAQHRYGFAMFHSEALREAISRAENSPAYDLRGIHFHLGSQMHDLGVYGTALRRVAAECKGRHMEEIVIGGGLAAPYVVNDHPPSLREWGDYIHREVNRIGLSALVTAEPGRSIAANAAISLYEVGTIKSNGTHEHVIVQGGMSDNPRPALYGAAYEAFLPRQVEARRERRVRVEGHHCESGDVLVRDGALPKSLQVGDIVAVPATGAYTYSMSSNYHMDLRPAVVFVRDGEARLVIRRQTYEDLLATDMEYVAVPS